MSKEMSKIEALGSAEIIGRNEAGSLMAQVASTMTTHMEKFATWFLAGQAAALTLLVGSAEFLLSVVEQNAAFAAGTWLYFSMLLGVVQKFLATWIQGKFAAVKAGEKMGKRLEKGDVNVDFSVLFREMRRGVPWGFRWLAQIYQDRVMAGDLALTGRVLVKAARVHFVLVASQIILAGVALERFSAGLRF